MIQEKRPIDANPLYDVIEARYKNATGEAREKYREVLDLICDQPTIDPEPVEHGEWIVNQAGNVICSECKTLGAKSWKRCPLCETKMDGRTDLNSDFGKGGLPF